MKATIWVLLLYAFFGLLGTQAQPYYYDASDSGEEVDDIKLFSLVRVNLQDASRSVIQDSLAPISQLIWSDDQMYVYIESFVAGNHGALSVYDVRKHEWDTLHELNGYIDFYHVIDAPLTNRIYAFPRYLLDTGIYLTENYDSVFVFDRSTHEKLQSFRVYSNNYTYEPDALEYFRPFLSKDESKLFVLVPDSSGLFFSIIDAGTGMMLEERKACGALDPFTDGPYIAARVPDHALIFFWDKERTLHYSVCTPGSGETYTPIPFPFGGRELLSSAGRHVVIERVDWIPEGNAITRQVYTGEIYIFDARTGKLEQRLQLAPQGRAYLAGDDPNTLFYLTSEDHPSSSQFNLANVTPVTDLLNLLREDVRHASERGWLNNSTLTATLEQDLVHAKDLLIAGDSVRSALEIMRFQKLVRASYQREPESNLTNKGYKLLFYNTQYVLTRLPEPPTISIPELPAALTVASPAASASFAGNAFHISADHAHGMLTLTEAARESLVAALNRNQQANISGIGAAPDIVRAALDFDPAVAIDKLLAFVTDTLRTSPEALPGTEEAPAIAYAPEGLKLAGKSSGTGVLIVDGTLSLQGAAQWRGLVIVRAAGKTPPSLTLRGKATITGGILIYNDQPQAARLDVAGHATVRYSRTALDLLRTALSATP